jgi:hypothetical protein
MSAHPHNTETIERIEEALSRSSTKVERSAPSRWRACLVNGSTTWLDVRLVDTTWLVVESSATRKGRSPAPWGLLRRNQQLPAGLKFVRTDSPRRARLRAELVLENDFKMLGERVREACESCRSAMEATRGPGWAAAALEGEEVIEGVDLAGLCEEAGWSCYERSSGPVAVPLEVRDGGGQALVASRGRNGLILTAEIYEGPRPGKTARRALACLLLRATSLVRLVRAFADLGEDGVSVGLEVCLSKRRDASSLSGALSALSVAWELCGLEAPAVLDEGIAAQYLTRVEGVGARSRVDDSVAVLTG